MTPRVADAVVAQIARALAATDPEVLLPQGRSGQDTRLTAPLSLLAAVELTSRSAQPPAAACLVADGASTRIAAPLLLEGGRLRRAAPGDGASAALVRMLATRGSRPAPAGIEMLTFTSAQPQLAPPAADDAGSLLETAITADQTHDSLVVGSGGNAVVVKWAVHAGAAPGPPEPAGGPPEPAAVAAVRHLHGAGFTEMPAPYGFLVATVGGAKVLLASVARYLPAAQDGWDWYVEDLQALVARRSSLKTALEPAAAIGAVVARMHLAFARPDPAGPGDSAPVTTADPASFQAWVRLGISTLDEAVAVTEGPAGRRLRARQPAAREVIAALGRLEPATTLLTRIHGDLHVGQVLRWPGGYAVSDFDGNPILAAAERSAPAPPARDVAGMLRALDHVSRIVTRLHDGDGDADAVVQGWIPAARRSFLDAYTAELALAGASQLFDPRLLPAFEVEQECRELVYAARHLPRWTYVPDAALGALLDRLAARPATPRTAARPAPPPAAATEIGT